MITISTAYTWAKRPADARNRVNAMDCYLAEDKVLLDASEIKRPGDRLFRVDVTEIEVPEPEPEEWLFIQVTLPDCQWVVDTTVPSTPGCHGQVRGEQEDYWAHLKTTRSNAKQAACDAWAEAGFANAPKTPDEPKRELTWWWVHTEGGHTAACNSKIPGKYLDFKFHHGQLARDANIQAHDEDSAIAAAEAAWADLAAQIGGAK